MNETMSIKDPPLCLKESRSSAAKASSTASGGLGGSIRFGLRILEGWRRVLQLPKLERPS